MSHRLLAEYIPRGSTFPQGRYGGQSTSKQVHDTAHKRNTINSHKPNVADRLQVRKRLLVEARYIYRRTSVITPRYINTWMRCTTIEISGVTDTLELSLQEPGCDQAHVMHKPRRLLTDAYNLGGVL